jgi:hypothetical protein
MGGIDHPFKSMFGQMEKMMEHMHKGFEEHFNAINRQFSDIEHGKAPGHVEKHTFVSKQTVDHHGNPVTEKYENSSYVKTDANGKKIGERQQYYQNSGNNYEKAAHERMLGNQGRKMVKERQDGHVNKYDYYRNMETHEGPNFDSKWRQAKEEMKFITPASHCALPYGCSEGGELEYDRPYNNAHHYEPVENEVSRKFDIPDSYKNENSPVRLKNALPYANDIAPTQGFYKPPPKKIANTRKEAFPNSKQITRKD